MLAGISVMVKRGLNNGRGWTDSHMLVALPSVMVASMASLTKCMQIFDFKMAWWIDGGDVFLSVHHRGVH
jgi:hypothetical protein